MRGDEVESNGRRRIHVLTGPTAVGKTALALEWAEAAGAEIVSCDPLLFYRGMDIGTAKPTVAERSRVRHHLIDIADVACPVDIRTFVDLALEVIAAIWERGRPVLVCGASGFYLQAFFRPVVDSVRIPESVRETVRALLEEGGLDGAVDALRRLNPGGLGGLDIRNPRRVLRALERCQASGRDLHSLRTEMDRSTNCLTKAEKLVVRLTRERADLDRRIEGRVRQMLAEGLIEEVEALRGRGLLENPSAARAVGYREILEWRSGPAGTEDLVEAISGNTRRLVRKQMNWFRNHLPPHREVRLQEGGRFSSRSLFAGVSAGGGSIEIP